MRPMLAFAFFLVAAPAFGQVVADNDSRHLTVSQWVRPAEPGTFRAKVVLPLVDGGAVAVSDARVVLLGTDGSVHRGATDSSGEVYIKGVSPGIYAMVAQGRKAFACYAMHVLDDQAVGLGVYPTTAEIAAAQLDRDAFEFLTFPYLEPKYNRAMLSIDDVRLDELVKQVRGNESYRVIRYDDDLRGRVFAGAARGSELVHAELMNVFLLKDGIRIAREITNTDGEFEFRDIQPGIYSLIAVGPDGLGVVGFELRSPDNKPTVSNTRNETSDKHRFVNQIQIAEGCPCECQIQVIPIEPQECIELDACCAQEEVIVGEQTILDECVCESVPMEGCGVPISGGGYVPGYGGGGYSGGGGGGFAGIAALAGIGAAVAAGSSNGTSSPPISPSVPQ